MNYEVLKVNEVIELLMQRVAELSELNPASPVLYDADGVMTCRDTLDNMSYVLQMDDEITYDWKDEIDLPTQEEFLTLFAERRSDDLKSTSIDEYIGNTEYELFDEWKEQLADEVE